MTTANAPPPVPCAWFEAEVASKDLRSVLVEVGEPALIALCTRTAKEWRRLDNPPQVGTWEARTGVWVVVEAPELLVSSGEGEEVTEPPPSAPPDFSDRDQFRNKGALIAFAEEHRIDIDPTARRSAIERALAEALTAKEEADG